MIEVAMFDDNADYSPGPPPTTVWIENELRRLNADREHWHARWVALKQWLGTHRDAADSKIIGMIEQHMTELEQQHLQLPPQMPTIILGDESE